MYVHKNSGATISDSDYDKLKGSRIQSKYSKVSKIEKKPTPTKPEANKG